MNIKWTRDVLVELYTIVYAGINFIIEVNNK